MQSQNPEYVAFKQLLDKYPQFDESTLREIIRNCGGSVNEAAKALEAIAVVEPSLSRTKSVTAQEGDLVSLMELFPQFERDLIRDILTECQNDLSKVVSTLQMYASASQPAQKQSQSEENTMKILRSKFPTFDAEMIADVLASCGGDYSESYRQLQDLSTSEIRPASFCEPEVDVSRVDTGNSFSKYFPKSQRRMLIFLDDSGSMAGSNVGQAQFLLDKLIDRLPPDLPIKVVIFGSKSHTRVVSDWHEPTDWSKILNAWAGKSGRTYLWECLLDFIRIENPTDLHLLLITDGADTESASPYNGIEGLTATVHSLNELGFQGEIHLVALGQEITVTVGNSYLSLAAATGGSGIVLTTADSFSSNQNELAFTEQFRTSVAARGPEGEPQRAERIRQYAAKVKRGEVQFVPTKVVCNLDPELIAAFAREILRAEKIKTIEEEREARLQAQSSPTDITPELLYILKRRRALADPS